MNQIGHRFRQRFVGSAGFGLLFVLRFQRLNIFAREKGEVFQVADNIAVVDANPELVKLVNAGLARIEPNGARFRLAEFGSVRVGDERERQAVDLFAQLLAAEINSRGDIAPLIAAADLEFAIVIAAKDVKIESLEEHVAELGVADADLTVFHAGAHALLADHLVDGKMLADIAQEIEIRHVCRPCRVIDQLGGIVFRVEVQQSPKLFLDAGNIGRDGLLAEQLTLGALAAGIPD